MGESTVAPVIVGLGVGVGFVVLFSALSELQRLPIEVLFPPEPSRYAEKAIRIALKNDTLQGMFDGKDMVVASVRDRGVTHLIYDCPINSCAIIIFAERPGINTPSVSAIVNIQSQKVVVITLSKSWQ